MVKKNKVEVTKVSYSKDDIVLAVDKNKIYEAKILRVLTLPNKTNKYFVHYQGWSRKFDTWVDENRIALLTDENGIEILKAELSKSKDTTKESFIDKKPKSRKSNPKEVDELIDSDVVDNKINTRKRSLEEVETQADSNKKSSVKNSRSGINLLSNTLSLAELKKQSKIYAMKDIYEGEVEDHLVSIDLAMNHNLKKHVLDDWNLICSQVTSTDGTNLSKLLKLPRPVTVKTIIELFLNEREEKAKKQEESVKNLMEGLKLYFDRALPFILLYRHEREQFSKFDIDEDILPSDVYGIEHLLRLFVKFPLILSGVNFPSESEKEFVIKTFKQFLGYLSKNFSRFVDMTGYCQREEALNSINLKKLKAQLTVSSPVTRNARTRRK